MGLCFWRMEETMTFKCKKLNPNAKVPKKAGNTEAGFDMFTLNDWEYCLMPGEVCKIPTGIALEIPHGMYGDIRPRSSAFSKGLLVSGVIDETYRGECFIMAVNISNNPIDLKGGKAYAQLILTSYNHAWSSCEEVEELSGTTRGQDGFGSTGNT